MQKRSRLQLQLGCGAVVEQAQALHTNVLSLWATAVWRSWCTHNSRKHARVHDTTQLLLPLYAPPPFASRATDVAAAFATGIATAGIATRLYDPWL